MGTSSIDGIYKRKTIRTNEAYDRGKSESVHYLHVGVG